jgi:hypothetical protein
VLEEISLPNATTVNLADKKMIIQNDFLERINSLSYTWQGVKSSFYVL